MQGVRDELVGTESSAASSEDAQHNDPAPDIAASSGLVRNDRGHRLVGDDQS